MNFENIRIEQDNQVDFEQVASQSVSIITAIRKQLSTFLFRSELQQAQASYRMKQQRQQREAALQNALPGLSLEEKLRHGLYRYMD
jgi:hypothetical protein